MTKAWLTAFVKRGVNESRFALATNQLISALRKKWPVDGHDGGLKNR